MLVNRLDTLVPILIVCPKDKVPVWTSRNKGTKIVGARFGVRGIRRGWAQGALAARIIVTWGRSFSDLAGF